MNQQRARRFRASQLAQIEHEAADRVANELAGKLKNFLVKCIHVILTPFFFLKNISYWTVSPIA
jgi:hypothetical protein